MDAEEKKEVIDRYNQRLEQHGHSHLTLGWDKSRHNLRFHILLSQWNLTGKSVLDFGCGFGDMFGYAIKQGMDIQYEGIDINEKLIEEGRKVYPEAKLHVADALIDGLPKTYDYILSSGVHNIKLKDNWAFICETFELFDKYSREGFAINFLSNRVDTFLDHSNHTDPADIVKLAYKYSNRIVLRNDYMPFDFTIFVNKNDSFDPDMITYPDYLKYM